MPRSSPTKAEFSESIKAMQMLRAEKARKRTLHAENKKALDREALDAQPVFDYTGTHKGKFQVGAPSPSPGPAPERTQTPTPPCSSSEPSELDRSAKRKAPVRAATPTTKGSAAIKKLRRSGGNPIYEPFSSPPSAAPIGIAKKRKATRAPLKHNARFGLIFAPQAQKDAFYRQVYAGGKYHPELDVCRCKVCKRKRK